MGFIDMTFTLDDVDKILIGLPTNTTLKSK